MDRRLTQGTSIGEGMTLVNSWDGPEQARHAGNLAAPADLCLDRERSSRYGGARRKSEVVPNKVRAEDRNPIEVSAEANQVCTLEPDGRVSRGRRIRNWRTRWRPRATETLRCQPSGRESTRPVRIQRDRPSVFAL